MYTKLMLTDSQKYAKENKPGWHFIPFKLGEKSDHWIIFNDDEDVKKQGLSCMDCWWECNPRGILERNLAVIRKIKYT